MIFFQALFIVILFIAIVYINTTYDTSKWSLKNRIMYYITIILLSLSVGVFLAT